MKQFAACFIFLASLLTSNFSVSQNVPTNILAPKTFSLGTGVCRNVFNKFPDGGNLIQKQTVARTIELGQLYHLSTYWYAPIPQDSAPTIDTIAVVLQQAGTKGNSVLSGKIYAADSSGPINLLATSTNITTYNALDTFTFVFITFASPVRVPDWVMLSVELSQQAGDTLDLLSSSFGCTEFPASSFIKYSDGSNTSYKPFRDVYNANDSVQIVPAATDFAIIAMMANHFAPAPPNKCADYFFMYADSVTQYLYHIYNVTYGKMPVTTTVNWGDGSSSTTTDTVSHTYATPGYYDICITMLDDSGCSSTFCDSSFYISRQDGSNQMITVTMSTSNSSSTGLIPVRHSNQQMSVSPNPCRICEVKGADNVRDLMLSDLLGRTVNASFTKTSNGFIFILPNHEGVYILRNSKTGQALKVIKN